MDAEQALGRDPYRPRHQTHPHPKKTSGDLRPDMLRSPLVRAWVAAGALGHSLHPFSSHVALAEDAAPPERQQPTPSTTAPHAARWAGGAAGAPSTTTSAGGGAGAGGVQGGSADPTSGGSKPQHHQRRTYREGSSFSVYRGDGTAATLQAVVQAMAAAQVVLLGEFHDDPVAHALQLELLKRAARARPARSVALSLEMFETDAQLVMDEFLAGQIREEDFLKDARPWPNYLTDYHPLVQHCKALGLPVVCANAPRRYVSAVGRRGAQALEQLGPRAQALLPPLPLHPPSAALAAKVDSSMRSAAEQMQAARRSAAQGAQQQQQSPPVSPEEGLGAGGGGGGEEQPAVVAAPQAAESVGGGRRAGAVADEPPAQDAAGGCPYIGLSVNSRFLEAQNVWDACMAFSIVAGLRAAAAAADADAAPAAASGDGVVRPQPGEQPGQPDALLLHVCGKFHCEGRLGVPEHLQRLCPALKVLVVVFAPEDKVSLSAEDCKARGLLGAGDFVVVTDAHAPRSFSSVHL